MTAPKLPARLAAMSEEINIAHEAWLWLKVNLAYLTGAIAVLVIGVILLAAWRLLPRADLDRDPLPQPPPASEPHADA